VRSRGFKSWLIRSYYEAEGAPPNSEALQNALALIEARACIDGPERPVFTRVGGHEGRVYIDLANEQWQAIEVSSDGWRVLESKQSPICFRRAPGMLALPTPIRGGSVDWLHEYVNVKSPEDFELMIAWLLAAMREKGPYPILVLTGEQGSAKSSCATILRSLIDPNTAPLRSFPREDRDLLVAALNGWVVAFDNVSTIPPWVSDSLCRLSSGAGSGIRKLYSDNEEELFAAQRPIILNGIEDSVNKADLADRTVLFTLEQIPEEHRKADQALHVEWEKVRPAILAALLDFIVVGLNRLPQTRLARSPRMADFALWGTACERTPGNFMRAYEGNRINAVEITLEHDLVASAVRALMRNREEWVGTAATLLVALANLTDENFRRGKEWPQTPRGLSGRLRRAAANLRKVGINILFVREGHGSPRRIHITVLPGGPQREGKQPSPPSPSPDDGENGSDDSGLDGDGRGDDRETVDGGGEATVSPSVSANPLKTNGGDGVDGGDGQMPTHPPAGAEEDPPWGDEPLCRRCGIPGNAAFGQLIRGSHNGSSAHYHPRCWTEERTKGPYSNKAMRD
jgi:hypothetical protein